MVGKISITRHNKTNIADKLQDTCVTLQKNELMKQQLQKQLQKSTATYMSIKNTQTQTYTHKTTKTKKETSQFEKKNVEAKNTSYEKKRLKVSMSSLRFIIKQINPTQC